MRAGCQRSQLGDERVGIDSPTPTPLGGGKGLEMELCRGAFGLLLKMGAAYQENQPCK